MLQRIGIVNPYRAEYVIKELLGDASAPVNETSKAILDRFNRYVQLGEDIIYDLRQNNEAVPRFDAFGDIVRRYIDDKTSIETAVIAAHLEMMFLFIWLWLPVWQPYIDNANNWQ